MNSNLKIQLLKIAKYVSPKIKKYNFRPNDITTYGILLNAFALINLLNGEFLVFILLFFTGYFCDILDGYYARTYNMETISGKKYDRFADWFKLLTTYLIFTQIYNKKITYKVIGFTILVFTLCNINYSIRKTIEDNEEDNICIKIWTKCVSWISRVKLQKISLYTRQFDESMTMLFLVLIMCYIHYN